MDRHGDLGDPWEAAQRLCFVWEGLLAHLPPDKAAVERRWLKLKRCRRAFDLWEWDAAMQNVVHDAAWRRHLMIDVVVTHPQPEFRDLVVAALEEKHFDHHRVIRRPLEELQHLLPHMPEITVVYHNEVQRPFLFGSRGRLVRRPGDVLLG